MIKPTLVVMAAGMGSRYGGLKQIDPIGPNGEIIIDYSIYDAIKAGFGKVVFVIKEEIEETFKKKIGSKIEKLIDTSYVFQSVKDIPDQYKSIDRKKPWGTAHAVLSCKDVIKEPFAVINADDFYGYSSFKILADYLKNIEESDGIYQFSMVGFLVENTLTEHGHVARGVCVLNEENNLSEIHERTKIRKFKDGARYSEDDINWTVIPSGSTVSMNIWGFTPEIFNELEVKFPKFLTANRDKLLSAEYFLPEVVGDLVSEKKAIVKVLPTSEKWYGVTYQEDKKLVKKAISDKIRNGNYSDELWKALNIKNEQCIKKLEILDIVQKIKFEGEFLNAEPYGSGHINDTFAGYFKRSDGSIHRYIIQKINHRVFTEPEKLMENIKGVTEHLKSKIILAEGDDKRETLSLITTIENKCFYKTDEGNYWRAYVFIEKAKTYDIVENAEHFYNAGKAFGKFQMLLSDYPVEKLHETILNFHDTTKRFEAFIQAVKSDSVNRKNSAEKEIEFVMRREKETKVLIDLLNAGKLPIRVTHNDTKFNNVMIDDVSGEGVCVIDLDTVMPGLSLYDFGDSIRSGTNSAAEDEKDLSKVSMNLLLFEKFTKGFLESAKEALTPMELDYLVFGAKLMTLECGMRFLTDYLKGDVYFKIHRENHNLDRARTQFKMVTDMEEKIDEMNEIVRKYR